MDFKNFDKAVSLRSELQTLVTRYRSLFDLSYGNTVFRVDLPADEQGAACHALKSILEGKIEEKIAELSGIGVHMTTAERADALRKPPPRTEYRNVASDTFVPFSEIRN